MKLIIRKAAYEDLEKVYSLIFDFAHFQKTPEKLLISREEFMKDANEINCVVAELDGKVVGFATYFFGYYSWSGKGLYLDDLFVSANFRGAGYGKALLAYIINVAEENRCKSVRWLVSSWNDHAIEFYRDLGAHVNNTELTCELMVNPQA